MAISRLSTSTVKLGMPKYQKMWDQWASIYHTANGNFIGNGSDGAAVISANTSLVVPNKVGSYDGDMVVKQYTSLTINSGFNLTTDQPCRGMLIYVQGDCTINGTLSMTRRGAAADPTVSGGSDAQIVSASGIKYGAFITGGTDTLATSASLFNGCGTTAKTAIGNLRSGSGTNYKVLTIPRAGTAGATHVTTNGNSGVTPADATSGATGGGAAGGGYWAGGGSIAAGDGAAGTCFSGGSGGGGYNTNSGGIATAGSGAANGGAGGQGSSGGGIGGTQYQRTGGGGAGNPHGASINDGSNWDSSLGTLAAQDGTGGLLILVVGGNLTIGSSGSVEANGGRGMSNYGGGSGGGSVIVLYKGSLTNSGTIRASGVQADGTVNGAIGAGTAGTGNNRGGNGSVQTYQML